MERGLRLAFMWLWADIGAMSRRNLFPRLTGAVLAVSLAGGALAQDGAAIPMPAAERVAVLPASPVAAPTLAGLWDLRIDGTTIFRFEIIPVDGGGWRGRWSRPESFNSNGNAFANLRGGVKSTDSMTGNAIFELVELSFDDPRPGAVPDIFRFRQTGPDTAEMLYVGTQLAPYRLARATAGDPLGTWDEGLIYRRPPPAPRVAAAGVSAPASTAAPATPQDRVLIGPQIRFLDLTPRAPEPTAPDPAAEVAPESAPESTPESTPATPPESRIDAGFLDDL